MKTRFSKIISIIIFFTIIYLFFFHDAVISNLRNVHYEKRIVSILEIDSIKSKEILNSIFDTISIPINVRVDSTLFGLSKDFIAKLDTIASLQKEYIEASSSYSEQRWEKWFLFSALIFAIFTMLSFFLELSNSFKNIKREKRQKRLNRLHYNNQLYKNSLELIDILTRYKKVEINNYIKWANNFYFDLQKLILKDFEFPNEISGELYFLVELLFSFIKNDNKSMDDDSQKIYKNNLLPQLEKTLEIITDNQHKLLKKILKNEVDRNYFKG